MTELILFARLNEIGTMTMLARRLGDLADVRILPERRSRQRRVDSIMGLYMKRRSPERRRAPLLTGTFALLDIPDVGKI